MFQQHVNRNIIDAAVNTLALIYHMTVHNLRKEHRNAVMGLVMSIMQSMVMVGTFFLFFWVLGIRTSPIRGDFILYIMSGIFMFLTHVKVVGAVGGSGTAVSAMMKHAPLNTAITISASALAVLYQQILSSIVILFMYSVIVNPVVVYNWVGSVSMFMLAWFSGVCVGIVFLALKPWWPAGIGILTQVYQRANMIASGKMFLANTLPPMMLNLFDWNPLFHIIDQTRGFAFINYSPHNSSLTYPIYVSITVLMIGLMLEFITRRRESLSWLAGH